MTQASKEFQLALADRYRIESELGEGTMATVYLARDLRHQRYVALKVLRPDSGVAMSDVRFVREIKFLAQLHHPNILPLHDSGRAAGELYYVMPYVRGESLRTRMEREAQLPVRDVVEIGCDVAAALAYAHQRGVIHRDIKPENILLHGSHIVLTDFGIARAFGVAAGEPLTSVRSVGPGTPAYMSPEQLLPGQEQDGRSDQFSLAIVLYEALTGRKPFLNAQGRHDNAAKMIGRFAPVSRLRPEVPAHVDAAISRALAPLAENRFASALEFAGHLSAPVAAHTPAGNGAGASRSKALTWVAICAAFILGVAATALVLSLLQ